MGFISRKTLPACGNMCVCCPALRPSSRRFVKRYKKLLAEIFPEALVDPYSRIGDDLQIYVRLHSDLKDFGSDTDQQAAKSLLADFRKMVVVESGQHLLDIIIQVLSVLTNVEFAQQLSETVTPEDGPLLGSIPIHNSDSLQALGVYEESLSLDEESSRTSSVNGDIVSELTASDFPRFIIQDSTKPPLSPAISAGQLLESALHVTGQVAGTSVSTSPLPCGAMANQCDTPLVWTRGRSCRHGWLVVMIQSQMILLPTLSFSSQSGIGKVAGCGAEKKGLEQLQALRLPPASPFGNFMRAAGC